MGIYHTPIPTKIFHITCINNLASILANTEIKAKNSLDQTNIEYHNIAYDNVQDKRKKTIVPIPPGGSLHDYVPFYFAPRSPMLDAIKHNKVEGYNRGQDDICYLISDAQKIVNTDLSYVFSNGHAIMEPLEFFNSIDKLDCIDWEIFFEPPLIGEYAKYWLDNSNREDKPKWCDRKRRRQAEFLVHGSFPWRFITEVATIDEQKKEQVQSIMTKYKVQIPVLIKPEWYYD